MVEKEKREFFFSPQLASIRFCSFSFWFLEAVEMELLCCFLGKEEEERERRVSEEKGGEEQGACLRVTVERASEERVTHPLRFRARVSLDSASVYHYAVSLSNFIALKTRERQFRACNSANAALANSRQMEKKTWRLASRSMSPSFPTFSLAHQARSSLSHPIPLELSLSRHHVLLTRSKKKRRRRKKMKKTGIVKTRVFFPSNFFLSFHTLSFLFSLFS